MSVKVSKVWIGFHYEGTSESGKTSIWNVHELGRTLAGRLGTIRWYAPWRKYAFSPLPHTVFEKDCLRNIADFCEMKTQEHKNKKKVMVSQ